MDKIKVAVIDTVNSALYVTDMLNYFLEKEIPEEVIILVFNKKFNINLQASNIQWSVVESINIY